ncbi:MAG: sugar ABC transporter substrate-binding protein [Lachnospiraceae bacterium]|nr:sugar ABC transporter substrate-binding protein [Lachnospiraceae bacterium]
MEMKRFLALGMAGMLSAAALVGCDNGGNVVDPVDPVDPAEPGVTEPGEKTTYSEDEIINFTMFSAMPGSEINDGNAAQEEIAKRTGVRVKETWLTGQTAEEAVGSILASGDLPDFIDGGDGMVQLYENDVLVAWDEYIEKYPNLKELYSDAEWEFFRQDDGKIYWANVFCNTYGEPKATGHNDEAFWIQCRVLEWANYPTIETLDDYFKVLEDYYAEHKSFTDPAGNDIPIIPYTALCDDWRYFCIENAPEFLDGYPNDGSVIVDTTTMKIVDYNTTPTAKKYFAKLNEEYNKGIIDKEFATQTYDEYIAKLSTGAILGMCDQNWDFNYTITPIFADTKLSDLGCEYVPLGLTIEPGMKQRWHTYGDTLNNSSGCAVTTSCEDPDAAFKFLSDILDQDIHDLRFWGIEGQDYLVDEDGMYYRTQEMRDQLNDSTYKASHVCNYSYMPQWLGTSKDGKNAMQPGEQASEFYAGLSEPLANTFKAYNAGGYPDMIGSVVEEMGIWYPMYSYSNAMTAETAGGEAWTKMGTVKHEWIPKVVMSGDFESEWTKYMDAYNACKPEDFLAEMQEELERRAAMAE